MLTNPPVLNDSCVGDPICNITSTYHGVSACLAYCLNSVLNVKVLVGAFNQEKALVGAFSVIVNTGCETEWIVSQH